MPNSPTLAWSAYRSFRNSTLSYLRSLMAKFFARLSSSPAARQFWSFVKKLQRCSSSISPTPSPCPPDLLCSQEQLLQVLSSDSAFGPDAIFSHMLKSAASSIAYPLLHIFNLSLKSGTVPSQ